MNNDTPYDSIAQELAANFCNELHHLEPDVIPWHGLSDEQKQNSVEAMRSSIDTVLGFAELGELPSRANLRSYLGIDPEHGNITGFADLYDEVRSTIDTLQLKLADMRKCRDYDWMQKEEREHEKLAIAIQSRIIQRIANIVGLTAENDIYATGEDLVNKIAEGKKNGERLKREVSKLQDANSELRKAVIDLGSTVEQLHESNEQLITEAANVKSTIKDILWEFDTECPTDDIFDMVRHACEFNRRHPLIHKATGNNFWPQESCSSGSYVDVVKPKATIPNWVILVVIYIAVLVFGFSMGRIIAW